MIRVLELAGHFNVPALLCVNKYDLNIDETRAIEAFAEERGAKAVDEFPSIRCSPSPWSRAKPCLNTTMRATPRGK